MKKIILTLLIVSNIILITACNGKDVDSLQESIDTLQQDIKSLQTELNTVKQERDKYKADYTKVQNELNEMVKDKEIQEGDVTVVVVDKVNLPQNIEEGRFSNRSSFHFSITNNTNKDIKGIQGTLDIQDMFGKSIMEISCDLVGNTIKPEETIINKNLGLEINEFMNDHVKVYTTEYSDLKFIYNVNKIMFADGTLKE